MTAPGDPPSELAPLLKEALTWVIHLHSGEATQEDGDAVKRWRQQSEEHEQAFRDAVKLWRTFGAAARAATVATAAEPASPGDGADRALAHQSPRAVWRSDRRVSRDLFRDPAAVGPLAVVAGAFGGLSHRQG
ncbi:MAG: FecR/PupR family sigma factor regulator [Bradyrhizobium sp.]